MPDHTTIALRAAAKSLEEVVAPAVDSAHPLAGEQLRLISGVLAFVEERLGHHYAYQRFELLRHLELAATLGENDGELPSEVTDALAAASDRASGVATQSCARTEELQEATAGLTAAISALVRAAGASDAETARRVNRAVLEASRELVAAQRAWFLPQGFESDPSLVPSLDSVLHPIPTHATSTKEPS
jgi:uncharacterized protein YecT (DUF1311 family)